MRAKAPPGLGTSGKALWRAFTDGFELEPHEVTQVVQAARCADDLDALAVVVAAEGRIVTGPDGTSRPHPALVESRQQRIALARLIAALRPPDADGQRPQRRAGARGTYGGAR